ncbi:hypothetical protein A1O3_03029 [Capronia epimyces CBS 606.96]|uniref:BTB domain-containing protein n=1 Tax=Capronia epimyces CBS 606.96 TaxID=1182542 RepID=W9YAU0_9EURO|nr:uncharacterized protein A1O3_03029 [Capronia epimyces CBS 606.96]EXJ89962.1 hypothetical protein A1O3_03029 [Capronia epimyces CBS 606.96]
MFEKEPADPEPSRNMFEKDPADPEPSRVQDSMLRHSKRTSRHSRTGALGSIPKAESAAASRMPLPNDQAEVPEGQEEEEPNNALQTDLSRQSERLFQFSIDENAPVIKNLLLLNQNHQGFNVTIECCGRVWKAHRRFVSRSAYFRTKFNVNDPRSPLTLKINDITFTPNRMDFYLLWLYTGRITVLSRWIDKLWPGEDMEGFLEILVLAANIPGEQPLLQQAHKEVEQLFSTKLWMLSDEDAIESADQARKSVDYCLEMLFEQESKTSSLNRLREAVMVEIFKKADQLLPKHKWLEDWIGRSPSFKSVFRTTRKELLDKGQIKRGPLHPAYRTVDEADARCEEFGDVWVEEAGIQDASASPSTTTEVEDREQPTGRRVTFDENLRRHNPWERWW